MNGTGLVSCSTDFGITGAGTLVSAAEVLVNIKIHY
jgi:hypothetical protein